MSSFPGSCGHSRERLGVVPEEEGGQEVPQEVEVAEEEEGREGSPPLNADKVEVEAAEAAVGGPQRGPRAQS